MACEGQHPRVAAIAIISDDKGRVVAGRRIGTLGPGQLSFPGGHLDYGEEIFACAERETLEETGLVVRGVRIIATTNDIFVESSKHYITLFVQCERVDPQQQPQACAIYDFPRVLLLTFSQRLEPNKCEGWSWMSWQDIKALADTGSRPQELFLPVLNLLRGKPDIESALNSA